MNLVGKYLLHCIGHSLGALFFSNGVSCMTHIHPELVYINPELKSYKFIVELDTFIFVSSCHTPMILPTRLDDTARKCSGRPQLLYHNKFLHRIREFLLEYYTLYYKIKSHRILKCYHVHFSRFHIIIDCVIQACLVRCSSKSNPMCLHLHFQSQEDEDGKSISSYRHRHR